MSIQVQSTLPYLADTLEKALTLHLKLMTRRVRYVLVDMPRGQALLTRTQLDLYDTVVVSSNPCPEYKLDVIARQPAALISQLSLNGLVEIIQKVEAGHSVIPEVSSVLTPAERFTLQLIAKGHTIKEVAALRGTKVGTTRNTVQTIYTKLGLKSAVQLLHYYYGNWDTLCNLGVLVEMPSR